MQFDAQNQQKTWERNAIGDSSSLIAFSEAGDSMKFMWLMTKKHGQVDRACMEPAHVVGHQAPGVARAASSLLLMAHVLYNMRDAQR